MFTPAATSKMTSELHQISSDYVDHGVLLKTYDNLGGLPWRKVRKEQGLASLWPLPTNLCRQIAKELNWRFVRAETYRAKFNNRIEIFGNLWIPSVCLAKGAGTDLMLIAQKVEHQWDRGKGAGVTFLYGHTTARFRFFGEEHVQLLEDWYAKCYHNPAMIEAITKRGKPHFEYEPTLKVAA